MELIALLIGIFVGLLISTTTTIFIFSWIDVKRFQKYLEDLEIEDSDFK